MRACVRACDRRDSFPSALYCSLLNHGSRRTLCISSAICLIRRSECVPSFQVLPVRRSLPVNDPPHIAVDLSFGSDQETNTWDTNAHSGRIYTIEIPYERSYTLYAHTQDRRRRRRCCRRRRNTTHRTHVLEPNERERTTERIRQSSRHSLLEDFAAALLRGLRFCRSRNEAQRQSDARY